MANHETDVSVAERQVYILSLLSSSRTGYTAQELANRLDTLGAGVTKRTILRDIDELSLNYAIEEEERNGKTYFKSGKFSLSGVDLTMEDMLSISFLRAMLSDYQQTQIGQSATEMLDKLTGKMSTLNQKHLEELKQIIAMGDSRAKEMSDVDPEIEASVTDAIDKKCKVKIKYHAWNSNEDSERVIHPFRFLFLDHNLCVEAYCELRKEKRTFRLSRIAAAEVLKDHFELPKEVDTDTRFLYISGDKPVDVKLQFDKETGRYIKEYHKQRADKLTDNDDGVLFEKKTGITTELLRWILQYGAGVKVLEPTELKDLVAEEIRKMADTYK